MEDTLMKILILVLAIVVIVLLFIVYHLLQKNHQMKKKVMTESSFEERLNHVYRILDGAPLPIYIRNAQGVFVYGNNESRKMMNYTEGKLNGKHLEEVMPDVSEQWIHTWLDEDQFVIRENKELNLPTQEIERNSGNVSFGVTKKVPIRLDESDEVYALSVTIDVTDFKAYENELKIRNDSLLSKQQENSRRLLAMERLASLGTMVSAIASAISTPIGLSVSLVSVLENDVENLMTQMTREDNEDDYYHERLKKIFESSKLLAYNLNKSNQLMTRFRLVANEERDVDQKNVKLIDCIETVISTFEEAHPMIDFSVVCKDDFIMKIYVDGILQVLNGLVHNAINHGFNGRNQGRIILEAYDYDDTVKIQVRNNGFPIPDDVVEVMYEPLFSSKKDEGYDGLGLSIIFNIVIGVMEGNIEHRYEEPWTIFEITLAK